MASEEHLGQQFMPITQLMKLRSADFETHEEMGVRNSPGGRPTISDVFEHAYNDRRNGSMGYKWDDFRKQVGQHGITDPVRVAGNVLTDGHHRAMMAMEQGHLFVPVKHYAHPAEYWGGGSGTTKSARNRMEEYKDW